MNGISQTEVQQNMQKSNDQLNLELHLVRPQEHRMGNIQSIRRQYNLQEHSLFPS